MSLYLILEQPCSHPLERNKRKSLIDKNPTRYTMDFSHTVNEAPRMASEGSETARAVRKGQRSHHWPWLFIFIYFLFPTDEGEIPMMT